MIVWRHLKNWVEVYLFVPLSLLSIYGAAKLAYILSGRRPAESPDFLVDYAGKAVEAVAIIACTSIAKQALGTWLTREEKIANPITHFLNTSATLVTLIVITYIFLH